MIAGIRAAKAAGFSRIKLNAVILKGRNDDEVLDLVDFAREEGLDISFIEEMPLGDVSDHSRAETFCSSDEVQERIQTRHEPIGTGRIDARAVTVLHDGRQRTRGSASSRRTVTTSAPTCNRVRVTVEGRLLLCLGNEHSVDLREVLRRYPGDIEAVKSAIVAAMPLKPERHHFTTDGDVQVVRFMNMTGG